MAALDYQEMREAFQKFHRQNPLVWKYLVRFAREAHTAGVRRLSIALLIERVRWETQVVTQSSDGFKVNNNHRAFYARRLMKRYPEFSDMFAIRKQTSRE